MADQTYNLAQTGAEVQAIINDANGVKGAGSTTSLTTDYIMLKDTSGAYHKIQKSSFTEAVRNTLASLLVNNDKGTTISQIAAIASGDFGSVTPANLASVLGVSLTYNKIYAGESADGSTSVSFPNWVEGLLMVRKTGGNAMGLYFVDNSGVTTLKSYGSDIAVSWQTNHIQIDKASDYKITYNLRTVGNYGSM